MVTLTAGVLPRVTVAGTLRAVTATSVESGFTLTLAVPWSFAGLPSARVCVATSVCPPSVAPPVFQANVAVVEYVIARPGIACVQNVRPEVASRSTTLNPPTCCPPMFWTVTTTVAVLPTVTSVGALTLVTAMSGGGITVMPMPTALLDETASASCDVAIRMATGRRARGVPRDIHRRRRADRQRRRRSGRDRDTLIGQRDREARSLVELAHVLERDGDVRRVPHRHARRSRDPRNRDVERFRVHRDRGGAAVVVGTVVRQRQRRDERVGAECGRREVPAEARGTRGADRESADRLRPERHARGRIVERHVERSREALVATL